MSIVLKLNNVTKELENKVHTQKINYVNKEVRKTLKHLFMNINNKYIECIEYLRKNIDSSKSKSRNGDINTKQTHATSIQKRKILSALHFFKIRNEMFSYKQNSKLLEDTLKYTNKINSSFFIISKILSKNKLMFIYRFKISCFFQRILYLYRENTLKNQIMQQEILTLNRLSARTTKEQEKIKQIILMSNIERKLYKLSINIYKCSIYVSKKNDSSYSLYLNSEKKRNIEKKLGNLLYRILETSFLHLKKRRRIDKLNQEVQHKLLLILKLFTNRLEMSALKKLNFSSTEVQISDDTLYRKEYLNFKILRTFLSLRKAIQYLKERFNSEVSESFIFVLSKGSLENDRRFMGLVDSTLKDIEKYDDPVVIRMGIQFILAKKYIGDIIFLKEQTELKQRGNENMMITENFLYVITKNCILKYKDNVIIESVQISSYMYLKKFKEQWYMYLDFNVYKINDIDEFYDFLKEAEDKFEYSFLNNLVFSKTERREDVIFIDFYIFDEKTFFIYKVKDKYLLFRDNEELLSFFKLKYTFFEEYFFLVEDFHLKKVNLQNMQKEVIKSNVSVNYLFANDDIVLFSSKNGSISIMRGKEMISFHKHASCLKEIIYIDDILYIITEDHKFSIVELNRNSRYDVFSFYGVFKKMYLYFNSIFILTELEIIKYNLRSGSVESWEFSIPKFGSIKCYTKDHDDYYEDVLNEYKMKNFKAEIEAIYQRIDESKYQVGGDIYYKDLKGKVIDYSLVLRYKAFIFVYDSHIKYIFNIPKRELYYSNGHLFAFKAKKNRKVSIDIYKIIDNKLLYITHKETKIHKLPEDVFYVNGNMFFLIDGKLWKNCIFIANILVLDNVKIIKESEKGTFALNNKGIYALQNTSYIKKSKNINDFHYLKDDLFYLKNSKELFCNEDLILSNFSGHTFFVNSTSIKIFELKDDHSELSIYENKTKVENVILKCSVENCIRSDIAKTKDDLLYLIE